MKKRRLAGSVITDSGKRRPTATEIGSVEGYIVAAAMSFTAAYEKTRRLPRGTKRVSLALLEYEFRDKLFKHCRRFRKMLRQLMVAAKKRRKK